MKYSTRSLVELFNKRIAGIWRLPGLHEKCRLSKLDVYVTPACRAVDLMTLPEHHDFYQFLSSRRISMNPFSKGNHNTEKKFPKVHRND